MGAGMLTIPMIYRISLPSFLPSLSRVVGLNGSGKSSLLRIMAGVDKEFDGVAVPMPGTISQFDLTY